MMGVPAVGVASSALLLGEQITAGLGTGLILVTIGVGLNLIGDPRPSHLAPDGGQ
jgi:drug/metabolite transporter (DMT)-like permease